MQRRNFGKSGATKYTHMREQDTTQNDSLWNASAYNRDKLNQREEFKNNILSKPSEKALLEAKKKTGINSMNMSNRR